MSRLLIVLICTGLFCTSVANAHQLSTAYLQASVDDTGVVRGELQIRLYDLDQAIGVDLNGDGELRWSELQSRAEDVAVYLTNHFQLSRNEQPCPLTLPTPWQIDSHYNESYLVLPIHAQCALNGELHIHYNAFFAEDSQHKLLVNVSRGSGAASSNEHRVISVAQPSISFDAQSGSPLNSFKEFAYQGVVHIWIGIDHILFLCSLLLTCVLIRRGSEWVGKKNIREIIVHTTWIVTAFTLAHSITLTLTALQILQLPSRWVEVGIAISVVLAALNNIFPIVLRLGWLTFAFGLLHGMGFAGALGELGIPSDQQLLSIAAFNIGVELGQLAIVLALLPVLIMLRHSRWYSRYILIGASIIIALVAAQWVFERIYS